MRATEEFTVDMIMKAGGVLNEADKASEGRRMCFYINGKVEKLEVPKRQNLDVMRKRLARYGMKLINA